jgi:hypothetical protein
MQKLTSPIPGHSRQAKTDFLQSSQAITDFFYSKLFQLGQNQFSQVKAIPGHSRQDKTDFLHSKPFKSGKNQLPTFHAIQVSQKPTFSIQSHSS